MVDRSVTGIARVLSPFTLRWKMCRDCGIQFGEWRLVIEIEDFHSEDFAQNLI